MRSLLALLATLVLEAAVLAQDLGSLRAGQWVQLKGNLDAEGQFVVSSVEVLPPSDNEELLGAVSALDAQARTFQVLGRTLTVTDRTRWEKIAFDELEGRRVRAQVHWLGPGSFEAHQVYPRGEGRDRIVGRLDECVTRLDGTRRGRLMDFPVVFAADARLENTGDISTIPLAKPSSARLVPLQDPDHDREDNVPGKHLLAPGLTLGFLFENQTWHEQNNDLDDSTQKDRLRYRTYLRAQLHWRPSETFEALLSPRYEWDARYIEGGSNERLAKLYWNEAWVGLHDVVLPGTSVYAGRQLFDDEREWIYKRSLDALRLNWTGAGLSLDLSASRMIDQGNDFDQHAQNLIGYLSNTDPKRHVALWFVDRRDEREPRNYPFYYGVRALGDFLPRTDFWFEVAGVSGYANNINLRGWGYDAGLTWKPKFLAPLYFAAGHAFGSGDDRSSPTSDESFRQTGLQKNNGKFGGVANFRYYGELFDPELSNLSITTLDIGFRPWKRVSLDLCWHAYSQVELADTQRNTNLRSSPDGQHGQLGQETDLVLGFRTDPSWDLNLVLGKFTPGDAFPGADSAELASLQFRWRF